VGVAIRMLWLDAPSGLVALVYLAAGWQMLLDIPAYTAALTAAELTMLAVGGGLYTLGAIVYALKRPNPWPAVFGFHEVFHTLVVLAALCHWVAVFLLTG
jgi:hemolysin III